MARDDAPNGQEMPSTYRVGAPRASDAIGLALRDAYERDLGLPEDMASMLRQLNGASTTDAR